MPRLAGKTDSGTRWAVGIVAVLALAGVLYYSLNRQAATSEVIDTTIVRPLPPRSAPNDSAAAGGNTADNTATGNAANNTALTGNAADNATGNVTENSAGNNAANNAFDPDAPAGGNTASTPPGPPPVNGVPPQGDPPQGDTLPNTTRGVDPGLGNAPANGAAAAPGADAPTNATTDSAPATP